MVLRKEEYILIGYEKVAEILPDFAYQSPSYDSIRING